MNESILNNSVVSYVGKYLAVALKNGTEKVTETVRDNVSTAWMASIILGMIGLTLLFIASKITQKLAKFFLYLLGIVLLIGLVLNFVM